VEHGLSALEATCTPQDFDMNTLPNVRSVVVAHTVGQHLKVVLLVIVEPIDNVREVPTLQGPPYGIGATRRNALQRMEVIREIITRATYAEATGDNCFAEKRRRGKRPTLDPVLDTVACPPV